MSEKDNLFLSVVVPVYNEASALKEFNESLVETLSKQKLDDYEIIYCNDGSSDNTPDLIRGWHQKDPRIKLLSLSRNFGKESALSAGIHAANGRAILMLDGDGQHPVELIGDFIKAWRDGAKVVIGVRTNNESKGIARLGSRLFYKIFNRLASQKLVAGSTDFRLIDRSVQQAFIKLEESERITRGLIDWLGFERQYIYFKARGRLGGEPTYGRRQLMKLATNSFISLSPTPLYVFGYLGVIITILSFILGIAVIIEQLILEDPWHWRFTGTAMLGILILFLVGLVLISQGVISLYISHVHSQSKGRPLYVIDQTASAGLTKKNDAGQ